MHGVTLPLHSSFERKNIENRNDTRWGNVIVDTRWYTMLKSFVYFLWQMGTLFETLITMCVLQLLHRPSYYARITI